jgi:ribonuclease Z
MAQQTARLTILGTAAAIPDLSHDNVYMALDGGDLRLLIDCGSSPVVRLMRAGLDFMTLDGLIVTHDHPDHIYGVPLLLMDLWLMGRQAPFPIYGSPRAVQVVQEIMRLYEWETWLNFPRIDFHAIPAEPDAPVVDGDFISITAWPVEHLIPTLGLRITNRRSGRVLAYTSDTMRGPHVVAMARNADILIHEATGDYFGHSTGADAARDALEANAKRLVLIHYPVVRGNPAAILEEAKSVFAGPVELAEDFNVYEL